MRRSRVAVVAVAVIVVVLVALAVLMHVSPFGSGGFNPSATSPSNTGASTSTASPSYPRLPSLNGTIVCLDGDEITAQLWSKMKDYSSTDPAVKPYVDWLREALSPEPHKALSVPWYPRYRYWWFNDRYGWSVPRPGEGSLVRMGVVKLPFGAGLIVTAYQDKDGLVVVVHGTVINETGWRELVARAYAGSGFNKWYQSQLNKNITVSEGDWVLWRIMLDGRGSKLRAGGAELPIKKVIVLLEMPVYYIYFNKYWQKVYSTYLEGAYWDVVGHPALALAIHLAYPPGTDSFTLYSTLVKQLTWRVVLTGAKYSDENNGATPFTVRLTGGYVCAGASSSTTMFASNALGAFTSYVAIRNPAHAISALMYPSRPTLDANGDGRKDAVIIIDTAHYSIGFIESRLDSVDYMPPLMSEGMPPGDVDSLYDPLVTSKAPVWIAGKYPYVYMRVVDAVLGLPDWLKAPWIDYALEKSNYTWYVEKAWNDTARYCLYRRYLEYWANWTEKNLQEPLYVVPPSMALALKDVLDKILVVYEAGTPPLREVNCTGVYQPGQPNGGSSGETGGGNGSSELPPAEVSLTVNATWDGHEYRGNATVDNTTIVVIIYRTGTGEWVAEAWVNGEYAYGEPIGWNLRDEIVLYFTYEGTSYKITVRIAEKTTPTTINATIQLTPVYMDEFTPWGRMPIFKGYVGTAVVNQTNVTVIAYPRGVDEYSVNVFINGTRAYGETTGLLATISFGYEGVEYRLSLELPEPPVINETMEPVLVPVDTMSLPLPNGTVINVTVYEVNETIKVGNVTIVVFGYVSRLGIDLDVYVFGVLPGNYSVNITGLKVNETTIEYMGALHVGIHHQAPENQLIPEDTLIEIVVQPLNLTIAVPVKG